MKLKDLFNPPLIEIRRGSSQPLGIKDPTLLSQLKPTNKDIEGFPLFALYIDDSVIFALKSKTGEILTVLIGTIITDFPKTDRKTVKINRSWTPEEYRNKGYSTAIYDGLPRLGFRLISDLQLSSEAISVWKKLKTKREVQAFDTKTLEFTDKDPLTHDSVVFVLENTGCAQCSILDDQKLFTE